MCTNITSNNKRKSPDASGDFLFYFLLAISNASAPSGSGIHQKSFNSDKLADSFPIKYIAADATKHNTPKM